VHLLPANEGVKYLMYFPLPRRHQTLCTSRWYQHSLHKVAGTWGEDLPGDEEWEGAAGVEAYALPSHKARSNHRCRCRWLAMDGKHIRMEKGGVATGMATEGRGVDCEAEVWSL
jgi:hypothetical protein